MAESHLAWMFAPFAVTLVSLGCASSTAGESANGGAMSQGGNAQSGGALAGGSGGANTGPSSSTSGGSSSTNGGTATSGANGGSSSTNGGTATSASGGATTILGGAFSTASGGTTATGGASSSSGGGSVGNGGVVGNGGSGGGTTTCNSKLTPCNNVCVDLSGSNANCGACGKSCPSGQSCYSGMCRCPTGQAVCNGACQDVSTNVNSCGSCTNVCAKGASCAAGVCTCPAPQAACSGTCVDVTKDPQNCGTCGMKCTGATQCLYGACVDPASVSCGSAAQIGKTCAASASIDVGKYWLNNNLWGASSGTGSQCLWRTCQSGDLVGWGTSWQWANAPGSVKSYASIVVGWHWGWKHTDTGLPVQLSSGKAVNCGWSFNVNQTGSINVSYDLFAHTLANPGTNDDPTDEIMIWLYRDGGAAPIGDTQATASVANTSWELHRGSNNRWNVFSYVRTTNATTAVLNMMDFMKDLVARGWMQNNKYLTSVQAGTEVFVSTGQLDTNGFYCRVP